MDNAKKSLDQIEGWIALAAGAVGVLDGAASLPDIGGCLGLAAGVLGVVQGALKLRPRKGA